MKVIYTTLFLATIIIFTNIVFASPVIQTPEQPIKPPETSQEPPHKQLDTQIEQDTLKNRIYSLARKYDVDPRLAWAIIQCESSGSSTATHINSDSIDIGRWQINNKWHEEYAKKAGYDIYNPEDNLIYGFLLLKSDGPDKHWLYSKPCWSKKLLDKDSDGTKI